VFKMNYGHFTHNDFFPISPPLGPIEPRKRRLDLDFATLTEDGLVLRPQKRTRIKQEYSGCVKPEYNDEYRPPYNDEYGPPRLPEGVTMGKNRKAPVLKDVPCVPDRIKIEKPEPRMKSQYKCVSWEKSTRKWKAVLRVHGKTKTIGRYTNELDAARTINFKCVEHGIPMKNPGIGILPPDTSKLYEEIKKLKEKLVKADRRIQDLESIIREKDEEIMTFKKLGYCVDLFQ